MYGAPNYPKKADGGPVEGPGTGTSDSIKKQVPTGSFIMPADSTAKLGFNPEMAKQYKESLAAKAADLPRLGIPGYGKNVPVNLSNGEYELPPEQVHAVGVETLNQVKDATHSPAAPRLGLDIEAFKRFKQEKENLPRLGFNPEMARQYKAQQGKQQFFADGGLVDDPDKLPRLGAPRPKTGIVDGLAGGAKALAGAALVPQAAIADGLRAGAARLAGGDPATLEGGAGKYRDMATNYAKEGWKQASGAAETIRSAGREALGVQPMAKPVAQPSATPAVGGVPPYNGQQRPTKPELPRLGVPGWNKTGVGAGAQGGEVATRIGTGGVQEFTNESSAVAGAQDLPRLGIGRVGDGVGTFSQAQAGDSQLAYDRNERAIAEREKMIQASRRGEIGEGGGRVTVVRDSSRSPSLADIQNERLDSRQAQTEALRAQTQLSGVESNQRMASEQLQQQKLQQDLATGEFSVQDRQRIAELQARMVDPALSEEERTSAREAYTSLSTQAKDRYQSQDVILGRDENGKDIRGTQLIDVTTGKPVAGVGETMPELRGAPEVGTRQGGYEFIGGDPADQRSWRKV